MQPGRCTERYRQSLEDRQTCCYREEQDRSTRFVQAESASDVPIDGQLVLGLVRVVRTVVVGGDRTRRVQFHVQIDRVANNAVVSRRSVMDHTTGQNITTQNDLVAIQGVVAADRRVDVRIQVVED